MEDRTRQYLLLYKSPSGTPGVVYPVVVRVQGLLGKFDLGAFGTWNGYIYIVLFLLSANIIWCRSREMAAGSIQFLNLLPAGTENAWEATQQSIRGIRQLVHNALEGSRPFNEPPVDPNRWLYFQRRVFSKVLGATSCLLLFT